VDAAVHVQIAPGDFELARLMRGRSSSRGSAVLQLDVRRTIRNEKRTSSGNRSSIPRRPVMRPAHRRGQLVLSRENYLAGLAASASARRRARQHCSRWASRVRLGHLLSVIGDDADAYTLRAARLNRHAPSSQCFIPLRSRSEIL